MSKDNVDNISDEQLAAFLDGNTNAKETMRILSALKSDPLLQETVMTSAMVDTMLGNDDDLSTVLPMERMAAQEKNNLCDFECEKWILESLKVSFDESELSDTAVKNHWLKKEGTPLFHVGRLLERNGLVVQRRYNSTITDVIDAVYKKGRVIIVVNDGHLKNEKTRPSDSFHSVVVVGIDRQDDTVRVYDPATGNDVDTYPFLGFLEAWEASNCYCVTVYERKESPVYQPTPINSNDIDLDANLLDLREAIAENAHEVWASARMKEGWVYGTKRDDVQKQTPDLVPYADLPDSEKQYDRDLAMETIKLVKKLGYDFIKKTPSEIYAMLIRRISTIEEASRCGNCGAPIFRDQIYCERCGQKIRWTDFHNPQIRN